MARKKSTPSGFDSVLDNIYGNAEQGAGITDIDHVSEDGVTEIPIEDEPITEPPVQTEDGVNNITDDPAVREDDSPIPDDLGLQHQTTEQTENINEPSADDIAEAQQVGLLFDAIGQSFGWNMADIEESERPLTVKDLTQYLNDVVQENSVPMYADDRVKQLDDYVKNGGKFEDFYQRQQETFSLDSLDLDDETNQKRVVRDLMKRSGYTDEQINRKIERYEDSDMLYEEAEDSLDRLREIQKKEMEEQAKAQQELAARQEQESRAFFNQVNNDINSLTDIRGIQIPKEDRRLLFDYIFKVDLNGQSQYAKDFNKNLSKNLIESAYFTMKADALISSAKTAGESSAAEKLRKILRHSSKNHTTYNADEKQKSVTDLLAGAF